MNFRTRKHDEVGIDLAPLIDVVFMLLIFFMVTTTFKPAAQLKIDLPEATTGAQPQEDETLEIAIDATGKYYVNGVEVASIQPRALMMSVQHARGDRRAPLVVIKADGKAPHQAVITAMDVSGKLGLSRISIATNIAKEPGK
ncbi:MAG: ExbD/TolR family protein [Thiotrichales bacterium]